MSVAVTSLPAAELDRLRRRTVWSLVAGVALGSSGHIAALTVATIVAKDLAGSAALAGAPAAAVVLGAALGATSLSWLMSRRGRRPGLVAGYAVGVGGAVIAVAAIVAGSFALLLAGSLLIGFGNSANQLSRYAAADLYPPARRATALGTVVWAATVGAVVGPNLVGPSGDLAMALGLPHHAGPYLVPIALVGLASIVSFVRLRPDPYDLADHHGRPSENIVAARLGTILRRPAVLVSIVALVIGQFVMVLIMTMTPLHMTDHGHDLSAVGLVLSAHTAGMYALAPVSGRLTDRFGSPLVIYAGMAVLAVAGVLAAVAPAEDDRLLLLALFLLGFGWNLGYVAGSALLTSGVSIVERTRVQGLADALIWSTAALASLGSGVLVASAGYATLGVLGAVLVAIPAWILTIRRGSLSRAPSTA
ncbi:MAG TPA: MFS transporter [Candidatus Limnocylindrales bacterium]|nr:MFS transporter [Candidatus Limnocylindrales bacterium]